MGGLQSVLRNGSLWADIFLTKNGASPNPHNPLFNPEDVHHVRKRKIIASDSSRLIAYIIFSFDTISW